MTFIVDILSLSKPRLSLFVVFTTAGGVWLAGGSCMGPKMIGMVLFTTWMVGSANMLNCYFEIDRDALMHRTANRPLPAGRLPPWVGFWGGFFGCSSSFVGLWLCAGLLTACLGLSAFFIYVYIYTPLKRISSIALLVGAIPGAIPPLMGWTAVTNQMDLGGLLLFCIMFCWQIPHFLAISLYLAEDYKRGGFRVYSLVYGPRRTQWMIGFSSIILVLVSLLPVLLGLAGAAYSVGVLVAGLGLVGWSVRGLLLHEESVSWARDMFMVTIVFVTVLVGAMLLEGGAIR